MCIRDRRQAEKLARLEKMSSMGINSSELVADTAADQTVPATEKKYLREAAATVERAGRAERGRREYEEPEFAAEPDKEPGEAPVVEPEDDTDEHMAQSQSDDTEVDDMKEAEETSAPSEEQASVDDLNNTTEWSPVDINIKVPDYSVYDTRNVQQELKANVEEIMEAYKNRERTEALREAAELEDMPDDDSDPTKEIIINKHQWRKSSRNTAKSEDARKTPKQNISGKASADSKPVLYPDMTIRQAAEQMTIEQMAEIVAQLQAEQERRKKEAAQKDDQIDGQMDISQWLSDIDDEPESEYPADMEKIQPTREIPVHEVAAALEERYEEPQDEAGKEQCEVIRDEPEQVEAETEFEEIPDVDEQEDAHGMEDTLDLEKAVNAGIERIIDDTVKSALGDTDASRYTLKEEERKFLDKYLYMSGMECRLCRYIGNYRAVQNGKSGNAGNIMIMGSRNTDKITFAVNLFKALHAFDDEREQKLARISADKLNENSYEAYSDKLAGQTLIVENAGRLKRGQIVSMMREGNANATTFIIVDEEYEINKLFAENSDFAETFTGCFLLKQYTVNELVDIAKDYADEQGWRIEDKALLKLYLILSRLPNDDMGNIVGVVKDTMERAAEHAKSSVGNKLFGRFRSALVIKESDFKESAADDDEEYDRDTYEAVSYTHLTLPTKLEV